jgi:hypothetical protein
VKAKIIWKHKNNPEIKGGGKWCNYFNKLDIQRTIDYYNKEYPNLEHHYIIKEEK